MHRNIKILSWFNFCVDFRLYAPVAIIYFSNIAGSYALGTSVFGIIMLSAAIFELPTGILSDTMRRKDVMVLGSVASVASIILYALGGSYWILAAGAACEGLSRAFFSGNNDALLHDTLTGIGKQDKYPEHFGKTRSFFQLASGTSALLGGIIAYFSFPLVLWLSVIPKVISVFLSLCIKEPHIERSVESNIYAHVLDATKQFIRNKRLRYLSSASIVGFGVGESAFQFYPIFFQMLWPIWAIGITRTLAHFAAAMSFQMSGRLINRFGELKLLITANVYGPLVNLLALLIPTGASPILSSTGSLTHGFSLTSMSSLQQKEFTPHQRATMASLNSLGGSLLFAPTSVLLGYVADTIGPIKALILIEIVLICNVLFYGALLRMKRKAKKK